MKIVICGSVVNADKMVDAYYKLDAMGHDPQMGKEIFTIAKSSGYDKADAKTKRKHMKYWHNLIINSDAILVCNYDKNRIKNYIGGNVLMEIGYAFAADKKVFLMNNVPDLAYKEEIELLTTKVLKGDLSKIK